MNKAEPTKAAEPSRQVLLAVIAFVGLATVAYLCAGVTLHLRQQYREQYVTHLQPGTSRDAVQQRLGSPNYAAPDDSEWLYYPVRSAFELPITPIYPTFYVRFSPTGIVSAAGISPD